MQRCAFSPQTPPDLAEVTEALECVVNETYRAGDIIGGIRDQIKKTPPRKDIVDLNEAIEEVIALVRGELSKYRVSVQTQLAEGLSPVHGDRVQLQQVMLNLILNAIEAMTSVDDEARELVVSTESSPAEGLLVAVGDSGPGIAPEDRERIFELLLHDEARRSGDWPLDMPRHHRRPWRTIVGGRASATRRRFSFHTAGARLNQRLVGPTFRAKPLQYAVLVQSTIDD